MSKAIKLVYWQQPNFGDAASPLIISRLSGLKIKPKSRYKGILGIPREILRLILKFQMTKIKNILFPWEENLLGVGSIISWGNTKSSAWGSGFMNYRENPKKLKKIYAVRGEATYDKLKDSCVTPPF